MPSKRKWLERWERENGGGRPSLSVMAYKPKAKFSKQLVKFSDQRTLVKFCKPEHNVLNGFQTIRLGTFEYYRELDPNFSISDENEAKETTLVNSRIGEGSQEALETLKEFTGLGAGNHYIQILGLNFVNIFHNCYIWCCSKISHPLTVEHGLRFDERYKSGYIITDANLWAKYLTHLLVGSILRIPFEDSARERINQLKSQKERFPIHCYHRDVVYVDEKKSKVEDGEYYPYTKDIPRQLRPIFVKPKKYSEDSEYRFVFIFQDPQEKVLAVRKDPLDLEILSEHLAEMPIAAI